MAAGTTGMHTSQPVLHGWLQQASMWGASCSSHPLTHQHWAPCALWKKNLVKNGSGILESALGAAFCCCCLLFRHTAKARVTALGILVKETRKNLSLCQLKGVFSEVQKYHSYKRRWLFLESCSYCQLFPQVLIFQRGCHNNSESVFPRSKLSLADRSIVLGDLKAWQVMCKWFSASHPAVLFLQTLHWAQCLVLHQVSFVMRWWMDGSPFPSRWHTKCRQLICTEGWQLPVFLHLYPVLFVPNGSVSMLLWFPLSWAVEYFKALCGAPEWVEVSFAITAIKAVVLKAAWFTEEFLNGVAEYDMVTLVGPISGLNCLYVKSILALHFWILVPVPFVFLGRVLKVDVKLEWCYNRGTTRNADHCS